jgi:hypothetical protein
MTTEQHITWENARSADGPAFVAWLHERGVEPVELASRQRTVRRWEQGAAVDFFAADELLTKLGLHAHEVPERVWRDQPARRFYVPTGRPKQDRCKRGHPLEGENLYVRPNGDRCCRTCRRAEKWAWKSSRPVRGNLPGRVGA